MEEHHESLLVLGLKFDEICDLLSHLNILYTSDSTIPEGTDISLRIQNHLAIICELNKPSIAHTYPLVFHVANWTMEDPESHHV